MCNYFVQVLHNLDTIIITTTAADVDIVTAFTIVTAAALPFVIATESKTFTPNSTAVASPQLMLTPPFLMPPPAPSPSTPSPLPSSYFPRTSQVLGRG